MHRKLPIALVSSALCLALPLAAQTTTNTLTIGETGATGCQGPQDPPTLTGGVPASARYTLSFDQSTRRLTLTIDNTSAIVAGEATPLLTKAFLNLPSDTVTHAILVSQSAPGVVQPDFELDLEMEDDGAGCLGDFELELESRHGVSGGIANPAATRVGGPVGAAVIGPATFVIEFVGPGAESLNARAISYGWSDNGSRPGVNAGAKFQAGGQGADESGFIGSTASIPDCATSMWLVGEPFVGTTVTFCRNGQRGCHDCLWVSLFPGPTSVGGITAPIGLPLLLVLNGNVFTQLPLCLPLTIPGDSGLIGLRVYFVLATAQGESSLGIPTYSFGDVFTVRLR